MSDVKGPGIHNVPVSDPDEVSLSPYDVGVEDLSEAKIHSVDTSVLDDVPFVEPGELTGNEPEVEEEPEEEPTEEPVEDKPDKVDDKAAADTEEVDDAELVTPFVDAFAAELGWEFEEGEKPQTIKDLINYMEDVIEENSRPRFANEELAILNEYVASGGSIEDYVAQTTQFDIEDADISSVSGQRRVVEQNLKTMGYSADRIRRTIARYEDADVLKEEAEDAIDTLKERAKAEREQLVLQQQQQQQAELAQQQQFYEEINNAVKNIDNVRGIPVAKADKQKLLDYIFTVGSDGQTQYQRDYNKDLTRNLIESAYFTMKGDSMTKTVKNNAQSEAVRALRERLKSSSMKTKSTVSTNKGADQDALSAFARGLGVR
jgi:hypothetical protein